MTWPPNPSALVLGSIVTAVVALAVASWLQRDRTRGARSFTFLALTTALWALAEGAQVLAIDPVARLTWMQLRVLAVATLPVAFLVFANDDTRLVARLDRHAVALLLVVPAVTVALAWTFPLQDLLWRGVEAVGARFEPRPGPWWWAHVAYGYAVAAAGIVVLARGRATVRRTARPPTQRALAGAAAVGILHGVWVAVGPPGLVDPTPFAAALAIAAVARDLLTHRVRDVVPMARELMILRSPDPVLVLDPGRRVLQANVAAAEMLDVGGPAELVGRDADEVLRDQPDLRRAVEVGAAVELEIAWPRHQLDRHYRVRTTPVPDRRGRRSGQLLYLQDVAREVLVDRERRAAERGLDEQRRATAVLLDAVGDLVGGRAPEVLLEDLLRRATEATATADGALFRVARDGRALERWRAVGRLAADPDGPTTLGEDLAGRAWRDRTPVSVPDYPTWPDRARGPLAGWVRAALAAPLFDGHDVHGVLLLVRPRTDRRSFSGGEQAVVVGLARLGALAVARQHRSDEIDELRREVATLAAPVAGRERPSPPARTAAAPAWRFEEVDLAGVVRSAARIAEGRAERRPGVDLVFDLPSDLPPVVGDRERLLRVATHLIARALATTHVGCVVLSLGRDHDREVGDALVLRVRDTGEPGDAATLARAFEPPQSGGSAVLHACAGVLRRHGGRLWSNASPRGGATVAIVVPLVVAATAPAAPSARDGW